MLVEKVKFTNKLIVRIGAILCVVVIALMTTMVSLVGRTVKKQILNTSDDMALNVISGRADEITNWLNIYVNDLRTYQMEDVVETGDEQQVLTWLEAHQYLRNEDYDYMFFCGKDGTTHRDTGLTGAVGGILERDYYKAMMIEGKKSFIGDMVLSKTSGQYVVPIALPAQSKGKTYGFFVGMLGFKNLAEKLQETTIGQTGFFFLVDASGKIIAHKNEELFQKPISDIPGADVIFDSSRPAVIESHQNDGIKFLYCAPVGDTGWRIYLSIDQKELLSPVEYSKGVTSTFGTIIEIFVILLMFICLSRIFKRIGKVTDVINELSTGEADLTIQLPVKKNDEIDSLIIAVNNFIAKFHDIMVTIKDSEVQLESVGRVLSDEVTATTSTIQQMSDNIKVVNGQVNNQADKVESTATVVEEISRNIESLDNMIQSQASSVVEASAAVEQMIGNINSVDKSVLSMAEEFTTLEIDARSGIEQNSAVNTLIQKIADQSTSMVDANSIIQSIAEQTNLLAMNAAIEAAHAGEAGKGFSVVADEIRKLAENSAEESAKIGHELNNIQEGISQVVLASTESEKSFQSVTTRINSTGELVAQIRAAMEEQQSGSQQILEALQAMNDSTSEVRGAADEMNRGGQMIMNDVEALQEAMGSVATAVSEINTGTDYVNETTQKLKDLTGTLFDSIEKVGNDVNQFKV